MDKFEALSKFWSFWSTLSTVSKSVIMLSFMACYACALPALYDRFKTAPKLSNQLDTWQQLDTANWNRQHRDNKTFADRLLALELLEREKSTDLTGIKTDMSRMARLMASGNAEIKKIMPSIDHLENNHRIIIDLLERQSETQPPKPQTRDHSIEARKKSLSQFYNLAPFNPFPLSALSSPSAEMSFDRPLFFP